MQVLKAYEAASGQLVNKTKSAVYLHHLIDMEVVSKVERITGIHRNDFPIIYLGCPIFYARRKLEFYQPLITKVMDKLQSWQGKLLLVGGRAVLISHVLQSMPMHLLSAVNPPKSWGTIFLVPQDFGIDENVHNVHDVTLDGEWDVDRLYELLPEDLAVHILEKIKPPSTMQVLDRPCWMLETRGYFSVKLAWEYTRRRDEPRTTYRMIWVKGLPFKVAFFMWKVWKAKLPLDDFLKRIRNCKDNLEVFSIEGRNSCGGTYIAPSNHKMLDCKCVLKAKTVSSNLQALVKVRNPGMDMVPHKWQDLLAIMENFTPKLKVTKVMWEFPSAGWLKVNTDGASRGNPGRSSIGFCIRNENGDIVKSVGKEIEETTNTVAEAKAMVETLRLCRFQQYSHVWLQTDSMLLKKIMDGIWKPPWIISEQVEEMMQLMNGGNYTVTHIHREGNKLADHLANYALDHGEIKCQQFWHLDTQGRRLVNEDKLQCPNLRVKVNRRY
uniref:Uncharacterized protein LOC104234773 n=1 Tax=Nicotiana sylvestris TaxID=4096 RepID=A0A1U7XJP4_NICSY|nr:PREDICTED: uncharacterized protein LOC104234773 [Nicotiana sylvestris]